MGRASAGLAVAGVGFLLVGLLDGRLTNLYLSLAGCVASLAIAALAQRPARRPAAAPLTAATLAGNGVDEAITSEPPEERTSDPGRAASQ